MPIIAAREAKNAFGKLLDTAQREPVTIQKRGRDVAVVLSKYDYDEMRAELQRLRSEAETEFLMRGENGRRLMESIQQLKAGNIITVTEQELDALIEDAD
jgi:prevent-host-death family protein